MTVGLGAGLITLPATQASAVPMEFVVDVLSDNPADGDTLREAIDAANGNPGADTVSFAAGLSGTLTLSGAQLDITDSLTIVGPGADRVTIDAELNSRIFHSMTPGVDLTISGLTLARGTSASFGGAIAFGDGNDLALSAVVVTDSQALDGGALGVVNITGGVQIERSRFDGNDASADGGAIAADTTGDVVEILDSSFEANTAAAAGGGVHVDNVTSSARIRGTELIANEATTHGGGAYLDSGFTEILDSTFESNTAGGTGGGAWATAATANVNVIDVQVVDNEAGQYGGIYAESFASFAHAVVEARENRAGAISGVGLRAPNGGVTVRDSTITGNLASSEGGALLIAEADTAEVEDTTVSDNEGVIGPGLVIEQTTTATIVDSTISGNVASFGDGGGLYAWLSAVGARNTTISGNTAAGDGGGVFLNGSSLSLQFATIVANRAAVGGGGVAGSATARFSVIADNEAPTGPDLLGNLTANSSALGDPADAVIGGMANLIGIDADLGPLADNGGPTRTHRPLPASPLIDAVDPAAVITQDYDQRGMDRVIGIADIGAVEVQPEELPVWIPVTPARLVDTRDGEATVDGSFVGGGPLVGETQIEFDVAGRAGIPNDARAAIVNMTAVAPTGPGFAVAHACLDERPDAAGLNYTTGVNLGNEVIAGLDDAGRLCVFVKTTAHLVVDVVGYVPVESPYQAVAPARLLETRDSFETVDGESQHVGRPGAEQEVEVRIAGRGGVPADAASAVLYVAAVDATDPGFVTLYDCEGPRPVASGLNHVAGINRGNEVVATLSSTGTVCVFTKQDIHVTLDVVGYLPEETSHHGLGAPARLLETRSGLPTADGEFELGAKLAAGTTTEIDVARRAGIAARAETVVVNVTAVDAPENGYLIAYDCGARPLASSLNYVTGVNGGNDIVVGLSDDGTLCIFTLRTIDVVIDASGYTAIEPILDEPPPPPVS